MNNQNNKKVILTVMFVAVLTVVVIGTSFAFFNYTRTGSANTLKVGRISFNHTQDGNITLTNIFPMSSEEFENSTIDPSNNVTINIEGDTTYPNGVEYLVTAEDVHITVNDKRIPLTLKVTSTTDLGNNDEDYFTNRGGSTNIHKVLSGGVVVDGQYLVVGYIAPGQTGVEGSLNISAYINSDNIVISDTYDGTESDNMGTTNEWVGNKTVFTTTEWNSLSTSSNSLSFKIRVEANEGIWVDPYTTPNLMNTIGISKSANIKEIRFIEETPLRMQRRYDASVGSESDNTKLDLTYQDTGKVLAWIEPITINPTGTDNELLNIKPSLLINENTDNNIKQIDNETSYVLYIASSGKTKWVTGNGLFYGFTNVEKITFENVDSSDVTDMSGMFYNCSKLTNVDLSGLGGDNLNSVGYMFYNCNSLKKLNMSNFNFGTIGSFSSSESYGIFAPLREVLEVIDLSGANFSGPNISSSSFHFMFYSFSNLKIVDLSNADLSKLTLMDSMFENCDSLIDVNFSNVNTPNIVKMQRMFVYCTSLTSINLSNLGSDSLNQISYLFRQCSNLKEIDMSGFNFGSTSMAGDGPFNSLTNLEKINLTNVNTSGMTNMNSMFSGCTNLKTIYVSNTWNTSAVTDSSAMFSNCTSLVGGNGTVFDSTKTDKTMAVIDTPTTPGYLTLKQA